MWDPPPLMTIGAVSQATGIPENTLRTWERRYGFPNPDRTDGGHRLYSTDTVERLRLVARALERGHRPAQVLTADGAALAALLGTTGANTGRDREVDEWMGATRTLDTDALAAGFQRSLTRLGLERFVLDRVVSFQTHVGEEWEAGRLQTFHEHFASERLREFLAACWRPLSRDANGPPVVLATLPGEQHTIGLHMAAALLALAGRRILFVGPNTPLFDLRDCVAQSRARALVLAISASATGETVTSALAGLRQMVPPDVAIVVGGGGVPRDLAGGIRVASLGDLSEVVRGL